MQIRSVLRTVLVNLAVLIGLWLGVLFLTALLGDAYNLAKSLVPKDDARAELPSYDDPERARAVLRDQKSRIKDYVPFVEWRHAPLESTHLNIDAEGRRVHAVGRDAAPDATTIGFFGGSTVWGTGVDDDGTIPARFDAITEGYRVTNHGERGYTTMQNLIDLVTLINTGRAPEVVVFYEGFNDIWVHCDRAVTHRLNSHMQTRRFQSALDRTAEENYLYNTLIAPVVAFMVRVTNRDEAPHRPACSDDPAHARAVAEMFLRTLETAQAAVAASGGRFHAFLQPNAFVGSPRTDHLDLDGQRHESQRAQFEAVYPLIRERMRARGHDWLTDLSDALDGDAYLLIDHTHVTARGNALIAGRIREALDRAGLSRRAR